MGNKPNMKPGKNEIIRRTNILMTEIERLKRLVDYNYKVINQYIEFKGDIKSYQQFLKERNNAINKESGELFEGTKADNKTGKGNSETKEANKKPSESNKESRGTTDIQDTGETGNIGL